MANEWLDEQLWPEHGYFNFLKEDYYVQRIDFFGFLLSYFSYKFSLLEKELC
jgi:hypothetical protein